jgi:hypothetical protein
VTVGLEQTSGYAELAVFGDSDQASQLCLRRFDERTSSCVVTATGSSLWARATNLRESGDFATFKLSVETQ